MPDGIQVEASPLRGLTVWLPQRLSAARRRRREWLLGSVVLVALLGAGLSGAVLAMLPWLLLGDVLVPGMPFLCALLSIVAGGLGVVWGGIVALRLVGWVERRLGLVRDCLRIRPPFVVLTLAGQEQQVPLADIAGVDEVCLRLVSGDAILLAPGQPAEVQVWLGGWLQAVLGPPLRGGSPADIPPTLAALTTRSG